MNILRSSYLLCILFFVMLIQSCIEERDVVRIPKDFVYTMGANRNGVIGDSTEKDAIVPYKVIGVNNVTQIATSSNISMALTSDGKVFAWGDNSCGQIGIGDTAKIFTEPKEIKGLPLIEKIATGGLVSLALDKSGQVWMWGTIFVDDFRESDPLFTSGFPVKVDLNNIIDIDCGMYHCVAVSSAGDVYTWGRNAVGMLGDGTNEHRITPQKIAGLANIKKVSAGYYHTLALSQENTLFSWGFNLHGELGNGEDHMNTSNASPSIIQNLHNVEDMTAGGNHNLCLLSDGTLWGWGENYLGEVGTGSNRPQVYYYPVQITSISGVNHIDATGESSIALTNRGEFWAWGHYSYSSMDGGYSGTIKSLPTRIEKLDSAKLISTGDFHYLIVK